MVGLEAGGVEVSSQTPLGPPKAPRIFSEVWALPLVERSAIGTLGQTESLIS